MLVASVVVTAIAATLQPLLDTRFAQVAPTAREWTDFERTPGRDRAVILIHGLRVHPFTKRGVVRAAFSDWQTENSVLVRRLEKEADVFAFAYAQTVGADEIAEAPDLDESVRRVRRLGYHEIVLVGYSAGGVIARQFVEDNPNAGVTKVIQVCAPNSGSSWAALPALCRQQADFLRSLTKTTRRQAIGARTGIQLPPDLEFVCVIGTGAVAGDGLVSSKSQWPDDLQRQGVPALTLGATHWHVLRSKDGVALLAALISEPQPRWDARHVAVARKKILGAK